MAVISTEDYVALNKLVNSITDKEISWEVWAPSANVRVGIFPVERGTPTFTGQQSLSLRRPFSRKWPMHWISFQFT